MNVKWMLGIVMLLVLAAIVIYVFVPKHYDPATGTMKTFAPKATTAAVVESEVETIIEEK